MRNKNQVKPMGMCQRFSLWQLHCVEQQSLSSRSWSKSWGQVAKDGCYQAGWWANRLGQSVCHQDQEIWSGTAWQSNEIWTLSTSNHTRGGPKTRTGQGLHKLDLSSGYWHFELYECQATWQHLIHHLACIGGADCLSEWVSHKKKIPKTCLVHSWWCNSVWQRRQPWRCKPRPWSESGEPAAEMQGERHQAEYRENWAVTFIPPLHVIKPQRKAWDQTFSKFRQWRICQNQLMWKEWEDSVDL